MPAWYGVPLSNSASHNGNSLLLTARYLEKLVTGT